VRKHPSVSQFFASNTSGIHDVGADVPFVWFAFVGANVGERAVGRCVGGGVADLLMIKSVAVMRTEQKVTSTID
jgi:hypothetical protein